jgi:hypothetical protein
MAAETPTSLKMRTRDEWRRAFDTALNNVDARGNHKAVPIYQRRALLVSVSVSTPETELDAAARALAVLWGTRSK